MCRTMRGSGTTSMNLWKVVPLDQLGIHLWQGDPVDEEKAADVVTD